MNTVINSTPADLYELQAAFYGCRAALEKYRTELDTLPKALQAFGPANGVLWAIDEAITVLAEAMDAVLAGRRPATVSAELVAESARQVAQRSDVLMRSPAPPEFRAGLAASMAATLIRAASDTLRELI